jgi:hypothetical protein
VVAAITAQHLEEALTSRFGIEWTAREDGNGFQIKGISGEMMRLFSSRRVSITKELRARAASQRETAQLAQASNFATRKGKEGALDLAQAHAGWADKLARTLGVPLASVAPSVWLRGWRGWMTCSRWWRGGSRGSSRGGGPGPTCGGCWPRWRPRTAGRWRRRPGTRRRTGCSGC